MTILQEYAKATEIKRELKVDKLTQLVYELKLQCEELADEVKYLREENQHIAHAIVDIELEMRRKKHEQQT